MRAFALALPLMLAACGQGSDAPGGVTANERKALDDAAEMLEKQRISPSAIPSVPAAPAASAQP